MNIELFKRFKERLDITLLRRTPCIMQTEAAECGLACIATIVGHYGSKIDLSSLRQSHEISSQGATLARLIQIAKAENLNARPLSLDLDEITELKLPCILHWDFNHFVVLVSVNKTRAIIHDPAFGRRTVGIKELSEHFTGVALEVWPKAEFTKREQRSRIQLYKLLSSVQGIWTFLGKILFLSVAIEGIGLLIPVGTQMVMDHVLVAEDRDLLTVICLSLLGLTVLKTIIGMFRTWSTLVAGVMVNVQWKFGLFNHMIHLPLSYFEKRQVGDVQSRFGSLDALQKAFTENVVQLVIDTIMVLSLLIMMIFYGKWLVVVVVGFTLIYAALRILTYNFYRQATEERILKEAKANSHFMESLYGIGTLKTLGIAEHRTQSWLNQSIDAVNAGIRISRFDFAFSGANGLISTLDQIVILWLGATAVLDHSMTLGMFVAFNAYRGQFSDRIATVINTSLQLRMLRLHSERIADISNQDPEHYEKENTLLQRAPSVDLRLENLSFQYDNASPMIFDNFSLEIKSGESVAIIGPSGQGKTTLMKIMSGLMQPTRGEVLINGQSLTKIGLNNYRSVTASVLQDDKLFAGSIHENIAAFNGEISREQVMACAVHAHIHEEIMAMPMGYETLVGELGGSLSGGQKQRVMIARALCKMPRIIFFDEATSHLDTQNEGAINDSIRQLEVTRIIIAHRQSTIDSADRVVDLSKVAKP